MASDLIAKIFLPALASKLKAMREEIRTVIESVCSDAEYIDHIVIAINEASMNVIQHAYKEGENGNIVLEIYKDNDQLVFHVIDFADSIEVNKIKPMDMSELRPGGLGLHIIEDVMDEMRFIENENGRGNILEMKVRLNPCVEKS